MEARAEVGVWSIALIVHYCQTLTPVVGSANNVQQRTEAVSGKYGVDQRACDTFAFSTPLQLSELYLRPISQVNEADAVNAITVQAVLINEG